MLEASKKREKKSNKKVTQISIGLFTLIISILIFVYLIKSKSNYSVLWIVGISIGFVLVRSRFCFTSSIRDIILVGNTSMLRAIIISLIISTIGIGIIMNYTKINDINSYNEIIKFNSPVGINTIIGAFLFGIGIVIAGGCASGTLMRIGEGFVLQFIVLIGIIIGVILSSLNNNIYKEFLDKTSKVIYLPDYFGIIFSIFIQLIGLFILYKFLINYDNKNNIMK